MTHEERIKELTLLLLYLTSWKEEAPGGSVGRAWKGYPFETLDALEAEDMICGSKRSKSVYLTAEGEQRARELEKNVLRLKRDSAATEIESPAPTVELAIRRSVAVNDHAAGQGRRRPCDRFEPPCWRRP